VAHQSLRIEHGDIASAPRSMIMWHTASRLPPHHLTHWPLIAVTMSMIDSMYDFETEMDIYVDCASKHFWARLLGMIEAVSSGLPTFSFSAMQGHVASVYIYI
jgi:hypothetical protein